MGIVPFIDKKGNKVSNLYISEDSGTFYFVKSINGKTVFKSLKTKSLTVARSVILEADKDARKTEKPEGSNEESAVILIKDHWNTFRDARLVQGIRSSTQTKMDSIWENRIEPFWGRVSTQDVTLEKVEEYAAWHRKYLKGIRFFDTLKYLNAIIRDLHKRGLLPKGPPPIMDIPIDEKKKAMKSIGRIPTDDEIFALLGKADFEMKVMILLAFERGMRQMEIGSLRRKQILRADGGLIIHLDDSKTGKERWIPVPESAARLMEEMIKHRTDYLFPTKDLKSHSRPQVFDRRWQVLKRVAGIKGRLRFHDLRHGAVNRFKMAGLDTIVACELLGMSVRQYQKTYGKLSLQDMIKAVEKLRGGL